MYVLYTHTNIHYMSQIQEKLLLKKKEVFNQSRKYLILFGKYDRAK